MPIKVLFIPVSSSKGAGEYMRSCAIAERFRKAYHDIDIRFVLSKEAVYAASCPYVTYLTPSSPTKNTELVNTFIESYQADVVIFDASGRVNQLKACQQLGGKTISISQHPRKLAKAMSWRRLRFTDRLWVAQADFALPPLSWWSKLKLSSLKKHSPLIIGPIFPPSDEQTSIELMEQHGLNPNRYIVINAGGGGHRVNMNGSLVYASEVFADAALRIKEALQPKNDLKIVLIYGPNFPYDVDSIQNTEGVIHISALDPAMFASILKNAHSAILGGGSTLLQAISYGLKLVAVPISKDQNARINACLKFETVEKSVLSAKSITDCYLLALEKCTSDTGKNSDKNDHNKTALLKNGLDMALEDFKHMIKEIKRHETAS